MDLVDTFNAQEVYMRVTQDGVGSHTIAWDGAARNNIVWPGSVEPVLSTGANDVDYLSWVWDGSQFIFTKLRRGHEMLKTKSMQGYWRLEGDGLDSSDTGNNGTVTGAVVTNGRIGRSLQYDGVDDGINVPNDSTLQLTSFGTLCAWVLTNAMVGGGGRGIISKRTSDSVGGIEYGIHINGVDRFVSMNIGDGSGVDGLTSTGTVLLDDWSHITITWDNGTYRIYIDGVEDINSSGNRDVLIDTNPLNIGRRTSTVQGQNVFAGAVDEAMVFSSALPETDIRRAMLGMHPLS
jgi:hypothetical protein